MSLADGSYNSYYNPTITRVFDFEANHFNTHANLERMYCIIHFPMPRYFASYASSEAHLTAREYRTNLNTRITVERSRKRIESRVTAI